MNFNQYQEQAKITAIYPVVGESYVYPMIGLSGEVGELNEKIKRVFRGSYSLEEIKPALLLELGDILWYVTMVATEFGFSMDDVASTNLEKLNKRMSEGKINGSGDNR